MKRASWIVAASRELSEQGWWPADDKRLELVAAIIEKHANPKSLEIPSHLRTDAFRQSLGKWWSYLTAKKHGRCPSAHTMDLHMKKLSALDEPTAIAELRRSMEHGWSAIFPAEVRPVKAAPKSMSPPVEPPPETARTKEIFFAVNGKYPPHKLRISELAGQLSPSEWASLDMVTQRKLTALLREVPA